MKRASRIMLFLFIATVVVAALWFTVLRAKPISVTVAEVGRGRVEALVVNSKAGTVKSRRHAQLSAGVGGKVIHLAVKKGDFVIRGQLLLRIDDAEIRAQLAQSHRAADVARASEQHAQMEAALADRELARNRVLAESGAIAVSLLDQSLTRRNISIAERDGARDRRRQAEAALQMAIASLEKTTLVAPFDGVIADISTEVGEYITPSPAAGVMPAVIDLFDPDSIYVSAPLDEVDLGKVTLGMKARIAIDALGESKLTGIVTRIAPYVQDVQEQNRTFEIEIMLDNSNALRATLLPGATADVEILLQSNDDAIRIPTYALMEGDKVLAVRDGVLVEVAVTVGLKNWEFVEVLGGLLPGDRIVTSLDRPEVKAGARVIMNNQ